MDIENIEFKMRAIHNQNAMVHHYIQAKLGKEPALVFNLREKSISKDDLETFFAWQLEVNIEIIFIKTYVFLEHLKTINIADKYRIDKKFLSAGLRAYVAHKGTQKDFDKLSLPSNKVVIADKIEIQNGQILFTLLSGDHTNSISSTNRQTVNLTKQVFDPHFKFIKNHYPEWLVEKIKNI